MDRWASTIGLFTLFVVGVAIATTSTAAFTDTTVNAGNSWSAGTVRLSDDSAGSVLFDAVSLDPAGQSVRCITVTYEGDITPVDVRVYGRVTGGTGLEDYMTMRIDRGTGGGFGSCEGFSPGVQEWSGTLATLPGDFARAAGSWAPASQGASATYRVSVGLTDDDDAQGRTAEAELVWEART